MTTNTEEQTTANKPRDQRLAFYHPNSAGNGAALQLEPRLNRRESDRYNCFFLDMAAQKTGASREGGQRTPATFDWENKLTVKLDFADLCELLLVLEGRVEKAGGQRDGLYHDNGKACTVISLSRNTEKGGYFLGLSRKDKQGGQVVRVHMALSEAEAIGLRCVFQASLFFITFHAHLFPSAREETSASASLASKP